MTKFMQRRGNPEMLDRLHELGDSYTATLAAVRDVSVQIDRAVEAGLAAGLSLEQLSEASGLSMSQLEYVLVSVDVQTRVDTDVREPKLRAAG
ncbi:MAG: hypothetical protein ABWY93_34650 [Mycobacterium sp.]